MKTKILSFLFVLSAALLISTSAMATGNAAPSPGQTATYSVTAGLASYEWKVLQSDGSTLAVATEYSWTQGTAATQDIKWLASSAGKSYKVWVQATDANGCKTDPQMFSVTVTSTSICIAKSTTGTVGATSTAAPTNLNQCSFLTAGTTGYNGTGSYGDNTTFFVTITGGIPSLSSGSGYTVTYTVSDGTTTTPVTTAANLTTDSSGAGALSITVNASTYVSMFTAATADKTVTITLNKVSINGEDVTNTCASPDNAYSLSVKKLPTISF